LRGFGLKVGPITPARFEGRIRELVAGHPSLETIAESLLAVRVTLRREFDRFEKQLRAMARCDTRAQLLTSVPGVGAIVSLTFTAAMDDPARFKSSKKVVTPTKYQSGETDIDGRISKIGDAWVRAALYEAANIILTKPLKGCTALKSWAMKLARRSGMKKARVALARKPVIVGWKVDVSRFRAVPFGADGKPLPELNLRPLAQAVVDAVGDMISDMVREELEGLLRQRAIGGWC
jgi:transposase